GSGVLRLASVCCCSMDSLRGESGQRTRRCPQRLCSLPPPLAPHQPQAHPILLRCTGPLALPPSSWLAVQGQVLSRHGVTEPVRPHAAGCIHALHHSLTRLHCRVFYTLT